MSRRLSQLTVAFVCAVALSACQPVTGPTLADDDTTMPTPDLGECGRSYQGSGTC
ncbi:MAG TPA: hypothetical protein VGA22_14185 [Gemmatimonadales bacterium]|jgi:hypothetical protein